MSYSFAARKRFRKSFGRIGKAAEMPNLIDIQNQSYEAFLQKEVPHEQRQDKGLHGALASVFPINDMAGVATLEYVKYALDRPKYDVEECKQRGINYSAPLKVTMRLIVWDVDEDTESREIKGIKEQDVYLGDIPLMTEHGTFIINGTERVIVSQMHRSPGVFFDHDYGKTHSSGKFLYSCRIIPYRGSWLDFEFDAKDHVYFRVDRRRKVLIGTLLRALGMESKEILDTFYEKEELTFSKKGWVFPFVPGRYKGVKLENDLVDAKTGSVILEAGKKVTPRLLKKWRDEKIETILLSSEAMQGRFVSEDVVHPETGEILASAGDELTAEKIAEIEAAKLKSLSLLAIDNITVGPYIRNSLVVDKVTTKEEALLEIYKVMRPGEPATVEAAEALFNSLFFESDRYDLSAVGRMKINAKLGLDIDESIGTLTKDDIITIAKYFVGLKDGRGEIDDIDHLGNRRVRSVGELLENQFRIGLVRMERAVIERMAAVEVDTVMPHDIVNSKLLGAVVREFFGSSQLSQFMDQTNPLSEVTHKRRLSALGPGGLTRDRAGFEVRDVHTTHYGRICPIETPEGPNIGLINSLATYAKINHYGFIETPYRRVENGVVTDEVVYLSAIEEGRYTIAQSNAPLKGDKTFEEELVSCRQNGEFVMVSPSDIDLMDVSPMQVISVAASLIPFLENDDANRALMGSNMQRQAVPLLRADAPLVGTGVESTVARDSGTAVVCKRSGIIDEVDSNRIVVKVLDEKDSNHSVGVDIYNLLKYQRTNQDTCINQRPLVKRGDVVKKGDIIADGPSTDLGELALGRNVMVAFMPWNGYNYEDSILISERIARDDVFTSVHIEQFEIVARDTRLGPEEVTRDIPNVGEEGLRHLDEVGIVHVGAEVRPGDILVGKVTPKSESPMTPEEKLLRAIFGEKAADVRDSSLRLPPGVAGTVLEVRVFSRRGVEKDERALAIEQQEVERLAKDRDDELAILSNNIFSRLAAVLEGKKAASGPKGFKAGEVTKDALEQYGRKDWWQFALEDEAAAETVEALKKELELVQHAANERFENKVEKVQSGDDLPQGALKVVKVFVAVKRKLQPGDKMAGRHGNKGVISRILPIEDMPHLEDGTPVDVVLNPLGVPSRMNVGQILETHLGWASAGIGRQIRQAIEGYQEKADISILKDTLVKAYNDDSIAKEIKDMSNEEVIELAQNTKKGIPYATPVFDGAKEADIVEALERAGLESSGQVTLIDGRTGEPFDRQVTVGYIYMLKLHHLVDDKIHARSIGPYSLVTQQPLGGKSHFGGQRFGEMECWALQAYGAAYTLQEMLTVKSDDVAGRIKMYESIVRGDKTFESGIPESFHVMIKELRSLCLNIGLSQSDQEDEVALVEDAAA